MTLFPETILTALRNTTTPEGATRALKEVEPIYSQIENSFQGPAIYAEIQRLRALIGEETWTQKDEATYAPLRRKKLRIEARKRKDTKGRHKQYGARKRNFGPKKYKTPT
jgi:hypothetical protein